MAVKIYKDNNYISIELSTGITYVNPDDLRATIINDDIILYWEGIDRVPQKGRILYSEIQDKNGISLGITATDTLNKIDSIRTGISTVSEIEKTNSKTIPYELEILEEIKNELKNIRKILQD